MSIRGLVNQELKNARRMVEQLDGQTSRRHAASQLLFAYRCFLLELADLHSLPVDCEYPNAHELLCALERRQGAGTSVAELEVFAENGWESKLQDAQAAYLHVANSTHETQAAGNQHLITAVQITDSKGSLSDADLVTSFEVLQSLIVQSRELSQEY